MEELENLETIRAYANAYTPDQESLLRELKTVKAQVLYLLKKETQARNNDFYLDWLWLRTFAKVNVPWLEWEKFLQVSGSLESVRRVRQKIQNEDKQFLPTDPKIREMRQKRSETMRKIIRKV